ncbi:MAG: hypothetical protein PHC28_15580, partial [Flavobacterium sp.]|uniref:hypothetical protein n=1 Tax=Flavobacterium sp. TaxID=239 RepID=UPI00261B1261
MIIFGPAVQFFDENNIEIIVSLDFPNYHSNVYRKYAILSSDSPNDGFATDSGFKSREEIR